VPPKHLISPNFHVIMIHFPLGIFMLGLFLEVFGFLWRRSSARIAARWMILFGGLMAVPAALSGIDAYKDVAEHGQQLVKSDDGTVLKRGMSDDQWTLLRKHMLFTGIGAGAAALAVTIGLGLSDIWRIRLYLPLLIVLIGAAVLMASGAHFGGQGIFLEGVSVRLREKPVTGIEYWAPARSTHILLAGLAMAVALGSLGASFRVLSSHRAIREEQQAEEELSSLTAPAAAQMPRRVTDDLTVARSLNADAQMPPPRAPAGRFWLLSMLLFIGALGFGVWYMIMPENSSFDLQHASISTVSHELWATATATKPLTNNRRGAHIALGAALVILPFLLAIAVRFMARARLLVAVLCLLMLLIIAAQIWMGILLIYKGEDGSIFKFTAPDTSSTAMALPSPGPIAPHDTGLMLSGTIS